MFDYGSQGIQPEGRGFSLSEEIGSGAQQSCKGKGGKTKERQTSQCEHCGESFTVSKGTVGRYCSHDCMHQFRLAQRPHWWNCSKCLASVGLGMSVQARLLRADKATLSRHWRKEGIRAYVPPDGSWKHYVASRGAFSFGVDCWWGTQQTAEAWLDGYNPRFPDWSKHPICKNEMANRWMLRRYKNDMDFRIRHNLRCDIRARVKKNNGRKAHKTERMLGCTIAEFRKHLESTFTKGLSWQNYGVSWEIDHIVPASWFDLTKPDHQMRCWNYSNLRALPKKANRKRGNRAHPQVLMTSILNSGPTPVGILG
jgi:transposase-like protein